MTVGAGIPIIVRACGADVGGLAAGGGGAGGGGAAGRVAGTGVGTLLPPSIEISRLSSLRPAVVATIGGAEAAAAGRAPFLLMASVTLSMSAWVSNGLTT